MKPAYVYRAKVSRILDVDTIVFELDLGFRVSATLPIRVRGIDSPEGRNDEGEVWARGVLDAGALVQSYKGLRSFERWVGDVALPDGSDYADLAVAEGFAVRV